jgi:hypothetical protein
VGLDEGGGPVHEVQECLVFHPRGHRAAAEAGGGAAVGVERRSAAKKVTDLVSGRALIDVRATFASRRWPWGLAVRPTAPLRSTERPAGEVIPATRRECAVWVLAGKGRQVQVDENHARHRMPRRHRARKVGTRKP